MESGSQERCPHKLDSERGFHATLNSVDLEQALEDGWRVPRCYEIYDWGVDNTTTTLFASMISVSEMAGYFYSKTTFFSATNKRESSKQEWGRIYHRRGTC